MQHHAHDINSRYVHILCNNSDD